MSCLLTAWVMRKSRLPVPPARMIPRMGAPVSDRGWSGSLRAQPQPPEGGRAPRRGGRFPAGAPPLRVQLHDRRAEQRTEVDRGRGGPRVGRGDVDDAVALPAVAEHDREL